MLRRLVALTALMSSACSATSSDDDGATGGKRPTSGEIANGISISRIEFYQSVRVSMMQDGQEVAARNATVVAEREGMFRVYVSTGDGFQARSIVARVDVGGSTPGTFEAPLAVSGPSNEDDPQSTVNVEIPAANIEPDSTYAVSLREQAPGISVPGDREAAEWPASGKASFGAERANGSFEVLLVPIVVNGITPDTSPARIQQYRERLLELYPVPDVNIHVHDAVSYGGPPPSKSGAGWGQLLDFMMQLHAGESSPENYFYYGVCTPAQSFDEFCGGACIAGLSTTPASNPSDPLGRTGTGLGFFAQGTDSSSLDTMAHELGHTAGLFHAPCMAANSDPNYPYPGGKIGVWGWDLSSRQFLDPNQYADIMGYCKPRWISDFTYDKIFQRIAYANSAAEWVPPSDPERAPGSFHSLIVHEDGTLEWGRHYESRFPIWAPALKVELSDAIGKVVREVEGFFYATGHGSGGTLLVRESSLLAAPHWASIESVGFAKLSL
jgi:Peptidase M66